MRDGATAQVAANDELASQSRAAARGAVSMVGSHVFSAMTISFLRLSPRKGQNVQSSAHAVLKYVPDLPCIILPQVRLSRITNTVFCLDITGV
jgi:hypothetical protein